jgi:multicomponent Na+:H+ antiporter subunit G
MSFDDILDLIAAICLLLGAFLSLAAGIGLLRFPDALSRLHAATKPQVLGLLFIVTAVALGARSWSTLLALLPVLLFQVLTAPISAHMVGRAGYRTGNFRRDVLIADELEQAVDAATLEAAVAGDEAPDRGVGPSPTA